jgi:hypothetical protein
LPPWENRELPTYDVLSEQTQGIKGELDEKQVDKKTIRVWNVYAEYFHSDTVYYGERGHVDQAYKPNPIQHSLQPRNHSVTP